VKILNSLLKFAWPLLEMSFPRRRESSMFLIQNRVIFLGSRSPISSFEDKLRGSDKCFSTNC
jgi:hypothetical protein